MLQNGNIDLLHEKKELEEFLSICLEKADLILGPEVQKPEEKAGMPAPEPEGAGPGDSQQGYSEPAAPDWGRREETPVVGEAAARVEEPSRVAEPPALETVRIPQPEETDTREKSIYETYAKRPGDEAPPEAPSLPSEQAVELPKSHFRPDDELSIPPAQLSALEKELASEKQQLDKEGTAQAADAADKSSLRKPSKNLAAMEFARRQAEQQKRMRTILAVLAAAVLILGIAWFVPFQKIADSLLGSVMGPSVQVDSKAAGAKDTASKK